MSLITPSVPAEARGKLRRFKAQLTHDYAQMKKHISSDEVRQTLVNTAIKNSKVGRGRAMQKVQRLLPGLKLEWQTKHYTVWSILRHRIPVIAVPSHDGEKQDAVCMEFVVSGVNMLDRNKLATYRGLWSIEVPSHALARMFHRSPNIDPHKALYQAHNHLLHAKPVRPIPAATEVFYLPAGDGVFLGHIISGMGQSQNCDILFYFRARTWLQNDQLFENQIIMPLGKGNDCYGKMEMLPNPLRLITELDDRFIEVMPLPKPMFISDFLDIMEENDE